MSITVRLAILALMTTFTAQAQNAAPAGPPAGSPMANSGIKLDQSPLFNATDTNKDGKLSKAEWAAIGGSDSIFSFVDKDQDGFLTLAELNVTSPPDMADANKDGKLSLEEFQTIMKASAPSGAPSGPPAATK